jgi:hypothetical protein
MDHENSQQAREFLRTYVNDNCKLINDWLDGSGNAEDVGSHLLCIMLERLAIDEKPDLSGIAGGYVIQLFQTVPGGNLALGRLMAQRLEAGLQIPAGLVPLCAKLFRQQPISDVAGNVGNKRGPKARNGRRDALVSVLARVLQSYFGVPLASNDALAEDADHPDSACEIVLDEMAEVIPDLASMKAKHLALAIRRFEQDHSWFAG